MAPNPLSAVHVYCPVISHVAGPSECGCDTWALTASVPGLVSDTAVKAGLPPVTEHVTDTLLPSLTVTVPPESEFTCRSTRVAGTVSAVHTHTRVADIMSVIV
jgi:hypothetical protein